MFAYVLLILGLILSLGAVATRAPMGVPVPSVAATVVLGETQRLVSLYKNTDLDTGPGSAVLGSAGDWTLPYLTARGFPATAPFADGFEFRLFSPTDCAVMGLTCGGHGLMLLTTATLLNVERQGALNRACDRIGGDCLAGHSNPGSLLSYVGAQNSIVVRVSGNPTVF